MPVHVELVSPERMLFTGDVDMVVCRTSDGDIAFLPGHERFLGALGIGVVRMIHDDGHEDTAAIHGGFVEVGDDRVIVLTDVAEMAGEIDVDRARQAHQDAEARMVEEETVETQAALARAHTRLVAAGEIQVT